MLSVDLAYSLKPSLWAREVLGFIPDPWQAEVLDSGSKRTLLLCSRQSGKSSVCAVTALHTAIFRPGSLVLMISPSLRQSSELFKKFMSYLGSLSKSPGLVEDTKLSLMLTNGSRVVSLPGSEATIRGYSSVSLLIVDEAARVEDDLYYSIRPMMAVSKGKMIALTTPWGKRGWFYQEWTEGTIWTRHKITALDCPRISPEFLGEERRSMPLAWFNAEYMCEFVEAIDSVFTYEQVMGAVAEDVKPLEFEGLSYE